MALALWRKGQYELPGKRIKRKNMHSEQMTKEQQKNLRRVVASSIIGAVIEWYDFFLYGVVAGFSSTSCIFPILMRA